MASAEPGPPAADHPRGRRAWGAAPRAGWAGLWGPAAAGAGLLAALGLAGRLDPWTALAVAAALAAGIALGRRSAARADPAAPAPDRIQERLAAEAVLETIPDPVILVDRRALVVEANGAARALLPALRARHPLSFALRDPDVLDGVERVLRTGAPARAEHVERVPPERAFEIQIGALPERGGAGRGVLLFFRDLTAARRLEHMRVDFVANASHELRTPLATLSGFIDTLQGPARDDAPARERFLAIMREQAARMTRLIDDLLSLSRIELRAHVAPDTPVALDEIVRQIVDALSPMAAEAGSRIELAVGEGPHLVLGDRDELLRVVENLVENAIKYGGAGGPVAVRVEREGGAVALAVADRGPGIAPEHLPRLTERFYRVDTATSRAKGGTGLGLAIVKHIVNRHRGRLDIASVPGEGATFKVSLPAPAGPGR
ncbi:MAG TPA: ATP-binding protein [Salinarimonas sp.]|nr:ATP-binding protein [Salinarimonas sp.]